MAIDRNQVIKEAQKFTAKGQFDKAIAEWTKIAKESPNDANVFNTIGDLCLKKNSKPEAVVAYQKAADLLADDGFTSKAIALYKKVLNIDPRKIDAHLALADLNAEKGLTGNALESYKIVADHYSKNHQTAEALGIYQKMADLNTSNVAFRLKLADMYAREGMKKEAIAAYLQAADVHVEREAYKDARQIFEKALAVDASNREVYHKAGLVYYKEEKFTEACKALKPAFEDDPSNAELAGIYLDSLARTGRGVEAAEAYQKLLAKDPGRTDLREQLYELYLSQKEFDKAFAEVSSLANHYIENKDLDAAEQALKRFIEQAPRSAGGKRALSALYKTIGRNDAAADMLVDAAEILLEDNAGDQAREALDRAVEIAPDHAAALQMLAGLVPMAAVEPEPGPEPEPAFAIAPEPEPEPESAPEPAPETVQQQPTPIIAPPTPAASPEDPTVRGALAEIDVLIKYGLSTKALEQLENLAKMYPESIQIRIKLRDVYGDLGNMSKAVTHMLVLADLYAAQGMQDEADEVLQSARQMDPQNAQIIARFGAPVELAEPAPESGVQTAPEPVQEAMPEEPSFLQEVAPPPLEHPAEHTSLDLAPEGLIEGIPPAGMEETAADPGEIEFDHPFTPDFPAPDFAEQQVSPVEAVEPVQEQYEELTQPGAEPAEGQYQEPAGGGAVGFSEQHGEPGQSAGIEAAPEQPSLDEQFDLNEIMAEAEFYYQQGLFDEARKHYEKILARIPDHEKAGDRIAEIMRDQEDAQEFSKLAQAVDGLEGLVGLGLPGGAPAEEIKPSASDEEAVRQLMQEIAQLKQKQQPPQGKPQPVRPESHRAVPVRPQPPQQRAEEDFFDLGQELNAANMQEEQAERNAEPEDDFFDLASELRDELSNVSVPAASAATAEEQSLDDIFEEFKKGVEQQAIKEDVDTHYNLGVAYKEMGLLDDAISEFIMTPEDEPKFMQSRYMLGLCYLEKADYENAIAEILHAVQLAERGGVGLSDRIGMSYDLGLAYQGAGNRDGALAQFQKVYAADRNYRDIANKVRELQGGQTVSLSQLKDDIEREISSKFLEEGERIEREEKTRKNERVRN